MSKTKRKIMEVFVLLSVGIGTFFMPLTAYAAEIPTATPAVIIDEVTDGIPSGEPVETEPDPGAEDQDSGSVDMDMSDFMAMMELFSMLGAADSSEPSESAIPTGSFTPDGHASVTDRFAESDGKEFYSFTTPAGNVFYLIIDHQRENNNVYFLNAVTETDLLTLAEKSGEAPSESGIPASPKPDTDTENPGETEPPTGEPEAPPKESGGNSGMMIFLVIAVLAVGGAGYYFKIVRPKQQAADNTDDDEDEPEDEDEYAEDLPSEDEPDEYGDDDDVSGEDTDNDGGEENGNEED